VLIDLPSQVDLAHLLRNIGYNLSGEILNLLAKINIVAAQIELIEILC
jgi:hypothetical protein